MDTVITFSKTFKSEVPPNKYHDNISAESPAPAGLNEYDYFTPVLAVKKLSLQSILACRGINQHSKSILEKFVFSTYPSCLFPNTLRLNNLDVFIREKLPNLPINMNPFIWRRAILTAYSPAKLQQFQVLSNNHGIHLRGLYLSVDMTSGIAGEIEDSLQVVLQVLKNIPRIQFLSLRLKDFGQARVNGNEEIPVAPALPFPVLNNLSELRLLFNNSWNTPVYISPLVSSFMRNLFETYGLQLDSFSCNNAMLHIGFPADFYTSTLLNIKQFQMATTPLPNTFNIMSQFQFPKLECLTLKPMPYSIPFSPSFLRMLENFRGSLTELCCEDLEHIELEQFENWNLKPLFKITKLTVYWKCIYTTALWSILQVILPNLRCLKFQPNGRFEEAPIPAYNRRQDYFKMFPQLEKLTWCVYGREMTFIEKTFVRNNQLPLCMYYEVPTLGPLL